MKGIIAKKPIGAYPYVKLNPGGDERLCFIEVYPMRVTLEAVKCREAHERERVWLPAKKAAALVDEGGLALIIDEWR